MSFTVGCVPYLNAKPLVKRFHDLGDRSPVRVVYAVPSELPEMIESRAAQAVMVSSIDSIRKPGMRVAGGVSISTQRDVLSVRMFSKVPYESVRTVAFDRSSMTSNALSRIVLKESFGVVPDGSPQPPVQSDMLRDFDACVLIGDNGMGASSEGLYVLDLGREWNVLTGLPFVWALWTGTEGVVPELSAELVEAARYGERHFDEVVRWSVETTGFSYEQCENYLGHIMDYRLTPRHLAGLAEFGRRLQGLGLIERVYEPTVVEASS